MGGATVMALGGGYGSAEQQRSVYRQRLAIMGWHVTVKILGKAPRRRSAGPVVSAAGQRVGDDPGTASDGERVAAGAGSLEATVSGQPGQAMITQLEHDARGDMMGL